MKNHNLFRFFLAPRIFFAAFALALPFAALAGEPDELVAGGDFADLDAWLPPNVAQGAERVIIEENSPFTDVYPSNGKCVKLVDCSVPHVMFLQQPLVSTDGTYVWSFDFKFIEPANSGEFVGASCVVSLGTGKDSLANIKIGSSTTLNLNIGKRPESLWRADQGSITSGVWYHFRCEVDLTNRTLVGSITSKEGDFLEFDKVFPEDAPATPDGDEVKRTGFDSIKVGSGTGPKVISPPVYLDNISVRKKAAQ